MIFVHSMRPYHFASANYSSIQNSNKITHLTRSRLRLSSTQWHSRSNLRNTISLSSSCDPGVILPPSTWNPTGQLSHDARYNWSCSLVSGSQGHWTHLTTCWEPAILLSDSRLFKNCKDLNSLYCTSPSTQHLYFYFYRTLELFYLY